MYPFQLSAMDDNFSNAWRLAKGSRRYNQFAVGGRSEGYVTLEDQNEEAPSNALETAGRTPAQRLKRSAARMVDYKVALGWLRPSSEPVYSSWQACGGSANPADSACCLL